MRDNSSVWDPGERDANLQYISSSQPIKAKCNPTGSLLDHKNRTRRHYQPDVSLSHKSPLFDGPLFGHCSQFDAAHYRMQMGENSLKDFKINQLFFIFFPKGQQVCLFLWIYITVFTTLMTTINNTIRNLTFMQCLLIFPTFSKCSEFN